MFSTHNNMHAQTQLFWNQIWKPIKQYNMKQSDIGYIYDPTSLWLHQYKSIIIHIIDTEPETNLIYSIT